MARPQQSTIFKSSSSQHCNIPRTYGPGKKKIQSKKHVKSEVEIEEESYFYPDAESVKTRELCPTIIYFNINGKCFSDITGASPHKSSRGNFYVMVINEYDSNAVLA